MLSNFSEFEVLLERYDDDPAICSKLLRTHALSEPEVFLGYAQKALLERPVSRALKFISGLAIPAGLIEDLLELYSRSREEALSVAQKVTACDPRFDFTLLEFLQQPRPAQPGEEHLFHVGLDILGFISPGDRLVAGVLKLLKHPNPKIRSKAALFVGSRTQNLAWVTSRTQDYDSRVRANIIESLYGLNSEFVNQMFWDNVADENNRVAGNAVLGLYLLGNAEAISLIYEMSRHQEARFRNTSAWIMGRTGDPRFVLAFSELMKDPDQVVRAQAFKGLGEAKKAMRASANRPQLKAAIVKAEVSESSTLVATVRDLNGQPVHGLTPTSFILKTGTPARPVRNYVVNEYDCRSHLNVAFVMCLPDRNEADAEARFTTAIQTCRSLKRPKDRWAILKISSDHTVSRFGAPANVSAAPKYRQKWTVLNVNDDVAVPNSQPTNTAQQEHPAFTYSANDLHIDAMLRESAIVLNESSSGEASVPVLDSLLHLDSASNHPHLIFLADSTKTHLIRDLSAKADVAATVHILAQSPAWEIEEVRQIVGKTGGIYRTAPDNNAFSDVCAETYSSLLHHYRIGWQKETGNLELDIYSEHGKASASYETTPSPVVADRLTA